MAGFVVEKAALKGAAFLFRLLRAGEGIHRLLVVSVLVGLSGCASVDRFGGSRQAVVEWGRQQGFEASHLRLDGFRLLSLQRSDASRRSEILNVYIEGDGAAWQTPFHPPRDPTPLQPTALALAAADPAPAVAYLGRPCQYLDAAELAACSPEYWTNSRFAPEVVAAYMAFLDRLKETSGARSLRLVGYSGGGVLATLLAVRRNDVERLVTVASPLAVAEWTAWHQATPLPGSLDPAADVKRPLPPATHFVGGRDSVVPPQVVAPFAARSGGRLREVPEFDHQCCWSRDWPRLLEEVK
ncbi:MAG: alpha/beta hydrolase [Sulfuritalea sp.]|nr:alpha/beta hydrolase [Sulfuritalea sp.]